MQSFDVSSGCLRPNVKTQAVARARDRNVNFGSWSAARVVCHGIDRRCSWQLEAALKEGEASRRRPNLFPTSTRASRWAPEQLPTKREITYSPLNIVRGAKSNLDRANARERTRTNSLLQRERPAQPVSLKLFVHACPRSLAYSGFDPLTVCIHGISPSL